MEKEDHKTKKENDNKVSKVELVEVESIKDLVKHECDFSKNFASLTCYPVKDNYRIISVGEKVKGVTIVYFYDVKKVPNFIVYKADSDEIEFLDRFNSESELYTCKINVLQVDKIPMVEKAIKPNSVNMIKASSYVQLLISKINKTGADSIEKVYHFDYNGKSYLVDFDLFNSNLVNNLLYAEVDKDMKGSPNFFKYNYNSDTIEINNNLYSDNLIYISIINLKKPFSFFKLK